MRLGQAFGLIKVGFIFGLIGGIAIGGLTAWQLRTLIDTTSKLEIVQWALRR